MKIPTVMQFTVCDKWYLAPIVLLLIVCHPLDVSAELPETGFWSLQLENDLWGSSDDRFYTHGTEISFATAEPAPAFVERITDTLPFYRKGDVGMHGFSIGQKIFTPEDIERNDLIEDDRPYAGWLFIDFGVAHLFEDDGDEERINGLILTLGLVGPSSLAEQTQKEFHRLIDTTIPQGWDHQLHDELGINVSYIRKWRHLYPFEGGRQFEVSRHGGLTLGNVYTYASAGMMARWGTRLKNDIGPPSISPGFPGIPAFRPDPAFNWYLFAGLEARAVAHNIFLDGNSFRDSHSVDKKNLVADLQFGVAFHFRDLRISFTNLMRSKEFEGQSEPTNYGAINFTFYTSR